MGDKKLNRTAADAASNDLETGAVRQCGQRRGSADLADPETAAVKLGRDFRTTENDTQAQIDALFAKKSLFGAQPQLKTASIGWNPIFYGGDHRIAA
jgi:hypothetical protein